MRPSLSLRAPAKINLCLAVGAARPDGFHSIASIFQAVDLHDDITLTALPGGGLRLEGDCGCAPERNTAFRAAEAFLATIGERSTGLSITIRKRIPIGSGLGGGSSDAAATLEGLARLYPGRIQPEALVSIAASIGSDVPFFLGSACAAVTGRGELVRPLEARTDYALVIVDPQVAVSTKEAYALLDASRASGGQGSIPKDAELARELERSLERYRSSDPGAWGFRNDFYGPIAESYPRIPAALHALNAVGARFAAMSGSGSAVYGVFREEEAAEKALARLKEEYSVKISFPLARMRDSI